VGLVTSDKVSDEDSVGDDVTVLSVDKLLGEGDVPGSLDDDSVGGDDDSHDLHDVDDWVGGDEVSGGLEEVSGTLDVVSGSLDGVSGSLDVDSVDIGFSDEGGPEDIVSSREAIKDGGMFGPLGFGLGIISAEIGNLVTKDSKSV